MLLQVSILCFLLTLCGMWVDKKSSSWGIQHLLQSADLPQCIWVFVFHGSIPPSANKRSLSKYCVAEGKVGHGDRSFSFLTDAVLYVAHCLQFGRDHSINVAKVCVSICPRDLHYKTLPQSRRSSPVFECFFNVKMSNWKYINFEMRPLPRQQDNAVVVSGKCVIVAEMFLIMSVCYKI